MPVFFTWAFEVSCGRVWVTAQPCQTLQPQHPPCHCRANRACQGAQLDVWAERVRTGLMHTWATASGWPPLPPFPPGGLAASPGEAQLPENGSLLLISSRQVIAFSKAAWLFGEKCHLSALHGGDLLEMLPAGARLSCRRHLVGKGENRPKVKEGGCRNSVSLWEYCLIQYKAALGHGSRAEPVV